MPETAWPEGVVARYLTKAAEITGDFSLTVDLFDRIRPPRGPDKTAAVCRGCGLDCTNYYESSVRSWAQAHAETCRAMPHPTA